MTMDAAADLYLTESRELLEEMESSLLQLEQSPDDEDLLNAIFRGAHTIKGTGGIFGFDEVEGFTHVVESVLDKLRDRELEIDKNLIALLLVCGDHMNTLVEAAVAHEALPEETTDIGKQLIVRLQQYLEDENIPFTGNLEVSTPLSSTPAQAIETSPSQNNNRQVDSNHWHISVRFKQGVLRAGLDPLSFLRYLTKIGEINHISTTLTDFPDIDDFDAESCYLGYEIVLSTDIDKQTIEDVFEFVIDDCTLHILPPRSTIDEYIELIDNLPENNEKIGRLLVNAGVLSEAELKEVLNIQAEDQIDNNSSNEQHPIGEVITEQGFAHKEVVNAAVNKQQKSRSALAVAKTLRVDADRLDELVNLVGELVIAGASTRLIASQLGSSSLIESMSEMSRLVEEIRDSALQLRMVQIGETFNRFQRVVRDVSSELGKNIRLEIGGGDTELDKTVVEKIADPLMHLVRNSMDHGIESAEQRQASGKSVQGHVRLNAYHDSGSIVIEVSDDGGGLDRDKVLAKALEKELVTEGHALTDQDIYRLVFEPGFSTAEYVTNLSGRGVGMDVVKKNIEALRGSVDITSEPGKGTTVVIRLPLTLAIIDGFLVGVGNSSYVVPLNMVHECVEMNNEEFQASHQQNYITLRDEILPLLRLREYFHITDKQVARQNIVVVHSGGIKAGLVVDELLGELQTVIKPLGRVFVNIKGLSGSTILGSGDVAIILDVPGLVQQAVEREGQHTLETRNEQAQRITH